MIRTSLLILLWFATLTGTLSAKNRNSRYSSSRNGKITSCAPGVVYVQLKQGSTVLSAVGSRGSISSSIAPASPFAKAIGTLGVFQVIPFDPAPKKDSIDRAFGIDRIYCLYYSNHAITPHLALSMLRKTGEVQCGSVRYLFPLSFVPNDSLVGLQYALTKMNVFSAWNTTVGDTSVVIADVDNAINIDNIDLTNEIKYNWGEIGLDAHGHDKRSNGIDDDSDGYIDNWEGWDFCGDVDISSGAIPQPNNNPRPRENGANHGTHTAGIILATGNNSVGIAGIAYGCKLLALKAAGGGNDIEDISEGFEAIDYACKHGARVINCSWGGLVENFDTSFDNIFLREASARGALVVAAAGNGVNNDGVAASDDTFPTYPADGPNVLSVGATDENDQATTFSNFGHSVSVWAPGQVIWSCDYPGDSAFSSGNGTSFAAPLAAGAAGIITTMFPTWTPQFIARQLIQTVDNVINPADRWEYWGRIDLDSAVAAGAWPGLVITAYSIDGVASDSLRNVGAEHDLNVTFKNVIADGTNIEATILPNPAYTIQSNSATLGAMNVGSSVSGDFHITRTGLYSEGGISVSFFVTDEHRLADTISVVIPLAIIPGFLTDIGGNFGTSIKRVSNSVAWAAFGEEEDDLGILNAEYAQEFDQLWQQPFQLFDGLNPPYDVEAIDSLNAYFGTGTSTLYGIGPFVVYTNDGQDFDTVGVSSFSQFVNTIHFFDPNNGILIGDPITNTSKWGIGITNDGGQTWNPLAKEPTTRVGAASWNNSACWVGDNGWFGTNNQQIWRTTNGGQTWKDASTGVHQNSFSVAFDDDAKHGMACFLPASGSGDTAMTISSDSGTTWQQLMTLPASGIAPGTVQFVPSTNIAILTTNKGIYSSSDFGSTWTYIPVPVGYSSDQAALSISREGTNFVASANSSTTGIASYAATLPDSVLQSVTTSNAALFSMGVYPNPAQTMLTVTFTLAGSDRVHVAIFDALGRNVEPVFDEAFAAGSHVMSVDIHALLTGAYYIDLETASGIHETRILTVAP